MDNRNTLDPEKQCPQILLACADNAAIEWANGGEFDRRYHAEIDRRLAEYERLKAAPSPRREDTGDCKAPNCEGCEEEAKNPPESYGGTVPEAGPEPAAREKDFRAGFKAGHSRGAWSMLNGTGWTIPPDETEAWNAHRQALGTGSKASPEPAARREARIVRDYVGRVAVRAGEYWNRALDSGIAMAIKLAMEQELTALEAAPASVSASEPSLISESQERERCFARLQRMIMGPAMTRTDAYWEGWWARAQSEANRPVLSNPTQKDTQ